MSLMIDNRSLPEEIRAELKDHGPPAPPKPPAFTHRPAQITTVAAGAGRPLLPTCRAAGPGGRPRGVRPRLEGKPRTPLSSGVATRGSWSPLSGLKGVQPPVPHSSVLAWRIPGTGEKTLLKP